MDKVTLLPVVVPNIEYFDGIKITHAHAQACTHVRTLKYCCRILLLDFY
jgi:hypothetical protein